MMSPDLVQVGCWVTKMLEVAGKTSGKQEREARGVRTIHERLGCTRGPPAARLYPELLQVQYSR